MTDKSCNIIEHYYFSVDKNLITNLCKNNNLKNLIKLSTVSDLYIFNKKNKKWYLKSKEKLLQECNNIKKKELKTSSTMLLNLAKLNTLQDGTEVKDICKILETKINNLDNLIKYINDIDPSLDKNPNILSNVSKNKINDLCKYSQSITDSSDSFIECYSNC